MLLDLIASAVDASGSVVIAAAVAWTAWLHIASAGATSSIPRQQRLLASSLVLALTLKSGAGLVRLSLVQTWSQLGLVAAIIVLRFVLGRVLHQTSSGAG